MLVLLHLELAAANCGSPHGPSGIDDFQLLEQRTCTSAERIGSSCTSSEICYWQKRRVGRCNCPGDACDQVLHYPLWNCRPNGVETFDVSCGGAYTDNGWTCPCIWSGVPNRDNRNCIDANACGSHPCSPNSGGCSNLLTGTSAADRRCSPCNQGFIGDGETCSSSVCLGCWAALILEKRPFSSPLPPCIPFLLDSILNGLFHYFLLTVGFIHLLFRSLCSATCSVVLWAFVLLRTLFSDRKAASYHLQVKISVQLARE